MIAPYTMAHITARLFETYRKRAQPAAPSDGNLYEASRSWTSIEGGWRRPTRRAAVGIAIARLAAGAAGAAA